MKPPARSRPPAARTVSWQGTPDPYAGRDSPEKRYDQGCPWFLWAAVATGVALAVALVMTS